MHAGCGSIHGMTKDDKPRDEEQAALHPTTSRQTMSRQTWSRQPEVRQSESPPVTDSRGRRAIAILEASKGIGALLALGGLLVLLHHDLHRLVLAWIGHLGLDPDAHYPQIVLESVDRVNATPVRTIALVATAYAAGRFIEAWGLWRDRAWGSWFGVVTGAMYLPFEIHHMVAHPGWQAALVLVINIGIVVYLLWGLRAQAQARRSGAEPSAPR